MCSLVLLLHVTAHIHYLEDVVVGTELQSTDVDLDVVLQEVFSQLANFLWPSGAPHQSLTVRLIKRNREVPSKLFQRYGEKPGAASLSYGLPSEAHSVLEPTNQSQSVIR